MAKPKVVTEMLKWMMETGRNDLELAKELSDRLPGKSITARQVFRWKRALSYPRPIYAIELEKISEGRLNAKTFALDSLKTAPPPEEEPPDGS